MPEPDLSKLIADMTTWATSRMNVWAAATQQTITNVVDGNYTTAEVTADINTSIARMAQDMTTFLAVLPGATPPDPT